MAASVLLSRIAEAYVEPRKSARRILTAQPTPGETLSMALAGVLLYLIIEAGLRMLIEAAGVDFEAIREASRQAGEEAGPPPPEAPGDGAAPVRETSAIESAAVRTFSMMVQYLIVTVLAWFIGRLAGGAANRAEIASVVAWHVLVQAPATVIIIGALLLAVAGGGNSAVSLILIGTLIYVLYMFASFIAEAHGFRKTFPVMAATIGVAVASVMVLVVILGLFGVRIEQ